MPNQIIKFDDFELDLGRYELRRQGQALKLEKVPMELLILLAEREGQLVTREEIIQRLWGPDVFVDTRQGINTAVRKIRLVLKDDPDNPRILQTVFGKGYRLMAPVTFEAGIALQAPASTIPVESPERSPAEGVPPVTKHSRNGGPAETAAEAAFPSRDAIGHGPIEPKLARRLFLVIQAGYLALYASAFVLFPDIVRLGLPPFVPTSILVGGLIGSAVRLYLITAVGFNYPGSGRLFRQAFPGVLVLDALWATSPLLLFGNIGYLALLCVAAMAFLPFSQRTLIASTYGPALPAPRVR